MKTMLTWIGHSCFRLDCGGYSIVFDPYQDGSVPGYAPVREEADLVLCSHEHGDHNARGCVKKKKGGENPFTVIPIPTFHDDRNGAMRGTNTIQLLESDTMRIAHMGDLGCGLTGEQKEMLSGLDVILVPVGGYYTIDAAQAAELVEELAPKIVVPMHYRGDTFGFDVLGTVDDFIQRRGDVRVYGDSRLVLDGRTERQTAVLEPKNKR